MSLSIIIPTLGRGSLQAALDSCRDADEIVVVLDTSRGGTLPCELPPNAVFAQGDFGVRGGHAGRQHGISLATGTHLAFFDDDDVYTPGAIQIMCEAACDVPVIFRMDHYSLGVLWRDPVIEFGNVSTQMYVVPNDPSRFGAWTPVAPQLPQPGGDYTFIKETCERMGGPVWRDEIIAVLRPSTPSVAVVTPWHNHPEFGPDYYEAVSVRRTTDELIVVDNGSTERTPHAGFLPFSIPIRLEENTGFSHACNVGLDAASADAVLFLNNDIRAADRDWLEQIRDAIEPGVLVGAELRNDPHGRVEGQPMPYLDGWCVGGMRDDLLELGGWDEGYMEPSYYGDNDLSLRARAAGMSLREVRCGLVHKVNGTARDMDVTDASLANRERFQRVATEILGVAA